MPTLRGRPGQPDGGSWKTRTCGCSAASRSSRAGVSSVEPSSTKTSSSWSVGSVCASSDVIVGSMNSPGLNTGTTTLASTGMQDVTDRVLQRSLELVVGARRRFPVGAPPAELGGVAKPVPLHVVVRDLDDELRPQRLERHVLPGVPAVARTARCPRGLEPGMPFLGILLVRRKLGQQLLAPGHRERRRYADVP